MEEVTPLPSRGTVFFDERDQGRSMRLSYHRDNSVFVVSLWRFDLCLGTFRLSADDAPAFVQQLIQPLADEAAATAAANQSETA